MKWTYLPWKYRSADTATKICNTILYGIGILAIISIIGMGYQMFWIHTLNGQGHQVASHRSTKEVPMTVDHQHYDYIYHTNTRPYNSAVSTIKDAVDVADHHDLSSYTDRVYWLKKYIDESQLNDDSNPLFQQKVDLKNGFIGMNTANDDQKNIQFIVSGKEATSSNDTSDGRPKSVIYTGTFDGTTQKIMDINALSE